MAWKFLGQTKLEILFSVVSKLQPFIFLPNLTAIWFRKTKTDPCNLVDPTAAMGIFFVFSQVRNTESGSINFSFKFSVSNLSQFDSLNSLLLLQVLKVYVLDRNMKQSDYLGLWSKYKKIEEKFSYPKNVHSLFHSHFELPIWSYDLACFQACQ